MDLSPHVSMQYEPLTSSPGSQSPRRMMGNNIDCNACMPRSAFMLLGVVYRQNVGEVEKTRKVEVGAQEQCFAQPSGGGAASP